MKERSKNAARCRREKENVEFAELSKLLPLPSTVTAQLDKASIIRLTSSYLKMRQLFPKGLGKEWGELYTPPVDCMMRELSSHLLQSLDGFVFILSGDTKIIYVSETASVHLGLSQVELTGNSIYDYIHESDFAEMEGLLSYEENVQEPQLTDEDVEIPKTFSLRMKCILAKRNAGLATGGFKVIHCRGYLKLRNMPCSASESATPSFRRKVIGLVAVGHSLPPSAITEIKMSSNTFMFRARLDFTLIFLEQRIQYFTNYDPTHLVGKSLYKFVHPADCIKLKQDHEMLLLKSQTITSYYRLLTCNGGWIWIQSQCMVIRNNKVSRQHCILALNHVLSEKENGGILFDEEQVKIFTSNYSTANTVSAPSKRSRLSTENKESSALRMSESSSMVPSLKADNLNQNHLVIMPQSSKLQPPYQYVQNNIFGQNIHFNKTDQSRNELQAALSAFDQVMDTVSTHNNIYSRTNEIFRSTSVTGEADNKCISSYMCNLENSPQVINCATQGLNSIYQKSCNFINNYTPHYPSKSKSDFSDKAPEVDSCVTYTQNIESTNPSGEKLKQCYTNRDYNSKDLPYSLEYVDRNKSQIYEDHAKVSSIPISANTNGKIELISSPEASQPQLELHYPIENCMNSIHSQQTGTLNQYALKKLETEDFNSKINSNPQLFSSTYGIQDYTLAVSRNFDSNPWNICSSSDSNIFPWINNNFISDTITPLPENGLSTSMNIDSSTIFDSSTNIHPPMNISQATDTTPVWCENTSPSNMSLYTAEKFRSSLSSSPGLSEISILSDSSGDHNKLHRYISLDFPNEPYRPSNNFVVNNSTMNISSHGEYQNKEIKNIDPSAVQTFPYALNNLSII